MTEQDAIRSAKWAFSTRRVRREDAHHLVTNRAPRMGDLVLASVSEIRQHKNVELPTGRKARLFPNDKIVVAYGSRYAPDQFEAILPDNLDPCHLAAAGGVASVAVARNAAMQEPTAIEPLGLIADVNGEVLNLARYALPDRAQRTPPPLIVVCGSSMNAGKTFTMTESIRGLRAAGLKVAAAKLTGTGAGGDLWKMQDAGADPVLDFTDAGMPATYRAGDAVIEAGALKLIAHVTASGAEAAVLEIADGVGFPETAKLLQSEALKKLIRGTVFAASDPLSAAAGVAWLKAAGHRVLAASGLMTAQPDVTAEARALLDVPVLTAAEIATGSVWTELLAEPVAA